MSLHPFCCTVRDTILGRDLFDIEVAVSVEREAPDLWTVTDVYSGGRWATPVEQSRNRRNAKLTFESAVDVALARIAGEPCKSIASRFGISESLPREIVKGRAWKDALSAAMEMQHG